VQLLFEAHPEKYRAIPAIGAACGLRQSELFGLAPEDVDFSEQVLRVRSQVKKLRGGYVYLGHADSGLTLRVYARMLPGSHDRAIKAIDPARGRRLHWAFHNRGTADCPMEQGRNKTGSRVQPGSLTCGFVQAKPDPGRRA
jgi:site-specific recombinase XerC